MDDATPTFTPLTVLEYLDSLRPGLPMSVERPCTVTSKSELRRWCKSKAVILNHFPVESTELVDVPIFSLVLFPKGKRRTTLV